jgi:hypothetical protein
VHLKLPFNLQELTKRGLILTGSLLVLAVLVIVGGILYLVPRGRPSNIVGFNPASFDAKANSLFFYSIGKELKYSDSIDPLMPTLMHGSITNFLVSPDGHRIAVVAKGQLEIVDALAQGDPVQKVAPVDSISHDPKPIGQAFFRDDNFQWSKDAKSLYLIKDEFYETEGSQQYSDKGELWRFDVATGTLQLVLKPFRAYSYFLGEKGGVYFSTPNAKGDLQLEYFDGKRVVDCGNGNGWEIVSLPTKHAEWPFFSFSAFDYRDRALPDKGVVLVDAALGNSASLQIHGKTVLTLTEGGTSERGYYCADMLRSVFLPGDRYFLLNMDNCENYNGQLLIDTQTGSYERLPRDTRVYITLNTITNFNYRMTTGGMMYR